MYCAAAEFYAVLQRPFLNFEARKSRHKRRMNVQDTVRKRIEKDSAEYPHEAGKDNQSNRAFVQGSNNVCVELFADPLFRWNAQRWQITIPRALKTWSGFNIADDDGDLRIQLPGCDSVGDGFKIRTAAGQQNAQPSI